MKWPVEMLTPYFNFKITVYRMSSIGCCPFACGHFLFCFYYYTSLKPLDIEFMRRLHDKVSFAVVKMVRPLSFLEVSQSLTYI